MSETKNSDDDSHSSQPMTTSLDLTIETIQRKVFVTANDKLWKSCMDESLRIAEPRDYHDNVHPTRSEYYQNTNIFMGMQVPMNDYLIREAMRLLCQDDDRDDDDHPLNMPNFYQTTTTTTPTRQPPRIVQRITHALYVCEETNEFLEQLIEPNVLYVFSRPMIDVLLSGYNVILQEQFTKTLLDALDMDPKIRVIRDENQTREETDLDLTEFQQLPAMMMNFIFDGTVAIPEVIVHQYKDHAYRLLLAFGDKDENSGSVIVAENYACFALVPHEQGVNYHVRQDVIESLVDESGNIDSRLPGNFLRILLDREYPKQKKQESKQKKKKTSSNKVVMKKERSDFYVQVVLRTIHNLRMAQCDDILAWRLVTVCMKACHHPNVVVDEFDGLWQRFVTSFRVVSGFHTELQKAVWQEYDKQRLLLLQQQQQQHVPQQRKEFHVRSVYMKAREAYWKLLEARTIHGMPAPLTAEFIALDHVQFYKELISKLISEVKTLPPHINNSTTSQSKKKQPPTASIGHVNARTLAVLGTINGQDARHFLDHAPKNVCYYQDDENTKGLFLPSATADGSSLLVFVTTQMENLITSRAYQQVQSPLHADASTNVNNWTAIRAALEFDPKAMNGSGAFRYDTPEFQKAHALLNESVTAFIQDIPERFGRFYRNDSDQVVRISQLRHLCECIAKRMEASSAWMVREMISLYIVHGATIAVDSSVSFKKRKDGYGQMELAVMALKNGDTPHSAATSTPKTLVFDEKVSLEGVECRVWRTKQFTLECGTVRVVLHFHGKSSGPHNFDTAMAWLQQGVAIESEVRPVDQDWTFTCLPFTRHVGKPDVRM